MGTDLNLRSADSIRRSIKEVVKNPKDLDILDNQEFINYIGDILVELLDEQLKNGQAIIE